MATSISTVKGIASRSPKPAISCLIRIFARGVFARANPGWRCGCQQRDPGALFTVLPCVGASNPVLQGGAEADPGGHDLVWVQRPPLANGRVRSPDYFIH